MMVNDVQLTGNFSLSEFRCLCCGANDGGAALRLATRLQEVRDDVGPMTIVSGFRCKRQNTRVGGKPNSQHLVGLAADILTINDAARYRLILSLLQHGFKRIGIGAGIIHADIGTITGPVLWTYYPHT